MIPIRLEFDGGTKKNGSKDSVSGCGAVIKDGSGKILHVTNKRLANGATNNEAEYNALDIGIDLLTTHDYTDTSKYDITIQGDSQIVIFQMTGKYKTEAPNLKKLNIGIKDKISKNFKAPSKLKFVHVLRDFNKDADKQGRLATPKAKKI